VQCDTSNDCNCTAQKFGLDSTGEDSSYTISGVHLIISPNEANRAATKVLNCTAPCTVAQKPFSE
jgi:hypothetical protein